MFQVEIFFYLTVCCHAEPSLSPPISSLDLQTPLEIFSSCTVHIVLNNVPAISKFLTRYFSGPGEFHLGTMFRFPSVLSSFTYEDVTWDQEGDYRVAQCNSRNYRLKKGRELDVIYRPHLKASCAVLVLIDPINCRSWRFSRQRLEDNRTDAIPQRVFGSMYVSLGEDGQALDKLDFMEAPVLRPNLFVVSVRWLPMVDLRALDPLHTLTSHLRNIMSPPIPLVFLADRRPAARSSSEFQVKFLAVACKDFTHTFQLWIKRCQLKSYLRLFQNFNACFMMGSIDYPPAIKLLKVSRLAWSIPEIERTLVSCPNQMWFTCTTDVELGKDKELHKITETRRYRNTYLSRWVRTMTETNFNHVMLALTFPNSTQVRYYATMNTALEYNTPTFGYYTDITKYSEFVHNDHYLDIHFATCIPPRSTSTFSLNGYRR